MESIFGVASNGVEAVSVGSNGVIYYSSDNGDSWAQQVSPVTTPLSGVAYGVGWMAVGDNAVVLTSPNGKDWTQVVAPGDVDLNDVAANVSFIVVGDSGTFAVTDDQGATWDIRELGTTINLNTIDMDSSQFIVTGDEGTVIIGNIYSEVFDVVTGEGVAFSSSLSTEGSFYNELLIDTAATGGMSGEGNFYFENIDEHLLSLDIFDPANYAYSDTLLAVASIVSSGQLTLFTESKAEELISLYNWPAFVKGAQKEITEEVHVPVFTGSSQMFINNISEFLTATPTSTSNAFLNRTITQSVRIRDRILTAWNILAEEEVSLEDSNEERNQKITKIIERVRIQEGLMAAALMLEDISQALACMEVAAAGKGASVADSITISANILSVANYYSTSLQAVLLNTSVDMTLSLRLPVIEEVTLDGMADTSAIILQIVSEGISFRLTFNTGDATYTGWVMNTTSFAVSEYDNYPFNSFAKVQGKYYGANDNGLYLLEGEDDAGIPIQARVKLGETNFGKSVKKRLDSVYLGFRADGSMLLKTISEGNIERWYKVTGDTEKLHRQRVHPLAKGLKAVWWEFELTNIDGADFEVSEIEFVPVMLSRSV